MARRDRGFKLKDSDKGTTAFWLTVSVVGGLALLSVVGAFAGSETVVMLWFLAAGAAGIAIVIGIILIVIGFRVEAGGVFLAVALSLLVLTVTCFANIGLYDRYA